MKPRLFSFDIFGTVVDWRRGLETDLQRIGFTLGQHGFDRIVDVQGADQQAGFRPYREITARSLVGVLGVYPLDAERIGRELGRWPAFSDSAPGLAALMQLAPCVAMTNSDREHGLDVQGGLGLSLSHWICAEELGVYKPDPGFWQAVSQRLDVPLDRSWWHVSAYADYDLEVAGTLGLTRVFVERPHRRPGPAEHTVRDLNELVQLATRAR